MSDADRPATPQLTNLTLPMAAATGGFFGEDSAVGPIVVGALLALGCLLLWRANRRDEVEPEETICEHPVFGPGAERASAATPVAV